MRYLRICFEKSFYLTCRARMVTVVSRLDDPLHVINLYS